jgi:hypothetical protein
MDCSGNRYINCKLAGIEAGEFCIWRTGDTFILASGTCTVSRNVFILASDSPRFLYGSQCFQSGYSNCCSRKPFIISLIHSEKIHQSALSNCRFGQSLISNWSSHFVFVDCSCLLIISINIDRDHLKQSEMVYYKDWRCTLH